MTKNRPAILFLSDFGNRDRFVSNMKGVVYSVDPSLKMFDITHEIEPFNVWNGALVLAKSLDVWPKGTIVVAVVDPGVGTDRKSLVAITQSGHVIIAPDNGLLTFVEHRNCIEHLYLLDEEKQRRPGSEGYHTFHGRDLYSYVAAKFAADLMKTEDLEELDLALMQRLSYRTPMMHSEHSVIGTLMRVEHAFGNIVTDIPTGYLEEMQIEPGASSKLHVRIQNKGAMEFDEVLEYHRSFGAVEPLKAILYPDSDSKLGLAINSGSFALRYQVSSGPDWQISITKYE